MSDLSQLYQQIILDHARTRAGEGLAEPGGLPAARNRQYNPTCGDQIEVQVLLEANGERIRSLTWEGDGCSVSMAAASVLAEAAPGSTPEQFRTLVAAFRDMLHSRGRAVPDEDLLGDAAAFAGVSQFVARIKCAMLGWVAAEEALREAALAAGPDGTD